jgi:hypothetical protein
MTASVLPSAAPTWAIRCWADDINVYAEVPSVNGPCVVAYRRSEGGLSQCLQTLGAFHSAEGGGEPYLRPAHIAKKLIADGITQPDLDAARAALLELGILRK